MKVIGSFRVLLVVLVTLVALSFAKEFRHSSGFGTTVRNLSEVGCDSIDCLVDG